MTEARIIRRLRTLKRRFEQKAKKATERARTEYGTKHVVPRDAVAFYYCAQQVDVLLGDFRRLDPPRPASAWEPGRVAHDAVTGCPELWAKADAEDRRQWREVEDRILAELAPARASPPGGPPPKPAAESPSPWDFTPPQGSPT